METCFVQSRSVLELVVMIPALVHFPISLSITMYTV